MARSAIDLVIARIARDQIVAVAAVKRIVVVAAIDDVVACLTKDQVIAEMREFMKGFVDEFDKVPSTYSVTRTLTKAEIQTMRRLVERTE